MPDVSNSKFIERSNVEQANLAVSKTGNENWENCRIIDDCTRQNWTRKCISYYFNIFIDNVTRYFDKIMGRRFLKM